MIFQSFYEVFTAETGRKRFIASLRIKSTWVTLDLNMPGRSGLDVLREIKNLYPEVEVIIVTPTGVSVRLRSGQLRSGRLHFKPYSVVDIITTVSNSFARRRNNQKIKKLIHQFKNPRSPLEEGHENSPKGAK